jgi:hypothetical protein
MASCASGFAPSWLPWPWLWPWRLLSSLLDPGYGLGGRGGSLYVVPCRALTASCQTTAAPQEGLVLRNSFLRMVKFVRLVAIFQAIQSSFGICRSGGRTTPSSFWER